VKPTTLPSAEVKNMSSSACTIWVGLYPLFFPVLLHLTYLFIGLRKNLWKGKEVAGKRWLPNLILDQDLEALPLLLPNPTRAKVGNLIWEQNQIIVQNRDHIPNPDLLLKEEFQNHIHGHQVKGAQDHPQRGRDHTVNQLEKEEKVDLRVQRVQAVEVHHHHQSTLKRVCSIYNWY